jgi:hypothetical protein
MITEHLNLIPPANSGKAIEGPKKLEDLSKEYFHAGNVKAIPTTECDVLQDMNKIITLRPTARLPYVSKRVDMWKSRGYFAFGKLAEGNVIFEIYSPHASVKDKFPPKQLETAVALFMVELSREGYQIPSHAIEYFAIAKK